MVGGCGAGVIVSRGDEGGVVPQYGVGVGSGSGPLIGQVGLPLIGPGASDDLYRQYRQLLNESGLAPVVDPLVEKASRKAASEVRDAIGMGVVTWIAGYPVWVKRGFLGGKTRAIILGKLLDEVVDFPFAGRGEEDRIYAETRASIDLRQRMERATAAAHRLLAALRDAGMVLPMLPMWLADP